VRERERVQASDRGARFAANSARSTDIRAALESREPRAEATKRGVVWIDRESTRPASAQASEGDGVRELRERQCGGAAGPGDDEDARGRPGRRGVAPPQGAHGHRRHAPPRRPRLPRHPRRGLVHPDAQGAHPQNGPPREVSHPLTSIPCPLPSSFIALRILGFRCFASTRHDQLSEGLAPQNSINLIFVDVVAPLGFSP
jgi:hypothetical protein